MWAKILIFLLSALGTVYGDAEYIVTHTPSHVTFQHSEKSIRNSELSQVISATYGFTINKDLNWDGLGATSLFARPKANVVISVEGTPRSLNVKHLRKYQAESDAPVVSTESVVNQLQTNVAADPLIVDFSTDFSLFSLREEHPLMFADVPATVRELENALAPATNGVLNITNEADKLFLGELHIIRSILNGLQSEHASQVRDSVPDLYHLKVQGLQLLIEKYGKSSAQVDAAITLLEELIDQVTKEFRRMYSDNVIIQVLTTEPASSPTLSRRARSLMQAESDSEVKAAATSNMEETLNVAPIRTEMFPVIFNIALWGGITYAVVLICVSYGIWVMDPGRDSIIYRMTSSRKKD